MALSDNRRLYDLATRLQIYTEDVKLWQVQQFNAVLFKVREELRRNLYRVKYQTLDGLTKAELNKLVITLRNSQFRIYSQYTAQLIAQLKSFMSASLEVNRRVWVTSRFELDSDDDDVKPVDDGKAIKFLQDQDNSKFIPLFGLSSATGNNDRMWQQIANQPIPANGLLIAPFIKGFTASATSGVEQTIRRAWANRLTVEQTIEALIGGGDKLIGQTSQLDRVAVQAAAVIRTASAHVAQMTSAAVQSAAFARYSWFSVIDGRTTPICISRNLKVYRFGEGPVPPAHVNCRSHIAPYAGADDFIDETFYAWIVRQPDELQDELLGEKTGEAIRNGKIKAKDIPKYEATRPRTIAEFRKTVLSILTR